MRAGENIKGTPLNETLVANWARGVPFGRREMPVQDAEERLKQSA